jgi:hypothetical protein
MYSENGTYYVPHPAAINYTADPSPELDRAWEELTWGGFLQEKKSRTKRINFLTDLGRYVVLNEQEAKDAFEEKFGDVQQFWSPSRGGYISG